MGRMGEMKFIAVFIIVLYVLFAPELYHLTKGDYDAQISNVVDR
jgi:hypothetical protein